MPRGEKCEKSPAAQFKWIKRVGKTVMYVFTNVKHGENVACVGQNVACVGQNVQKSKRKGIKNSQT